MDLVQFLSRIRKALNQSWAEDGPQVQERVGSRSGSRTTASTSRSATTTPSSSRSRREESVSEEEKEEQDESKEEKEDQLEVVRRRPYRRTQSVLDPATLLRVAAELPGVDHPYVVADRGTMMTQIQRMTGRLGGRDGSSARRSQMRSR